MATRTDRRRDSTHRHLLDTMYNLAINGQLATSSVHQIAEAADVAVGTFYNHFESRDAAVAELSATQSQRFGEMVRGVNDRTADPALALETIARGLLRLLDSDSELGRFMLAIGETESTPRGQVSTTITEIIERGRVEGSFHLSGDADHRGYLVTSLIRAAVRMHGRGQRVDEDVLIDSMLAAAGARR